MHRGRAASGPGAPPPVEAFKQKGADFVVRKTLSELVEGMNALTPEPLLRLAEIERQIQVIIPERVILRRIEHFKQGRRRIAAKIPPQFIHLIQHEHWIVHACPPHRLNDAPRHGSDIRAAMPAQFRFIMYAA